MATTITPQVELNPGLAIGWVNQTIGNSLSSIPPPETPLDTCPFSQQIAGFAVDFLYLRAMEEGLRYAEIITSSTTASVTYVNQEFNWEPAVRLSVFGYPTGSVELFGEWTYFHSHPDPVQKTNASYQILTGLTLPAYNVGSNQYVNSVSGDWSINLNSYRTDVRTQFLAKRDFYFFPSAGIFGGTIHQSVHVQYGTYQIVSSSDHSPQTVNAKSQFTGVGPEIGLGLKYKFLQNNAFFAEAHFAFMYGWFNTSTLYSALLFSSPGSTISMHEALQRWTPFAQIQVGYSHVWNIRKDTTCEVVVAWEEQYWGGQMRLNWYSTIVSPQMGSSLSLGGVVLRNRWSF